MKNFLVLILGLLIINAIGADILLFRLWQKTNETIAPLVENKIISPTATPTILLSPTPTLKPAVVTTTKKVRSISIIPIPGSGTVQDNSWKDISGTEFNLNTEDYPTLTGAYLEVNMKLFNGNGVAFVRLFDITTGIEVWGSEVKTSSQNFTVITSDKLILRSGNHQYRIQAKSLTADTTVYNSGRIKLITEN